MSQEIVYTSAPRGLKPNASGFCTVLCTNGMARNLSERLESLSGYRFHFQAHDADAHLNPVNYSHLKMTVGGEPFHVLSRIGDAGLDHTMRSNKLAHHVAFKSSEIAPTPGGGPAWTLMAPGFCETVWEGEPRRVAEGRKKLPTTQRTPQPCAAWQKLTGDAGWAGVLAQSALDKPPKPMSVIFPPGTDTLSLVVEAMQLLTPAKRWDVTFSTYFTRLEAGTECQWRFVLDGTPEAAALRHDPHKPKIDLSAPLGRAPDNDLTAAARTGKAQPASASAPPHHQQPDPSQQPAATPGDEDVVDDASDAPAQTDVADEYDVATGTYALQHTASLAPPPPLPHIRPPRRRGKRGYVILGSLLLFALIAGGIVWFMPSLRHLFNDRAEVANSSESTDSGAKASNQASGTGAEQTNRSTNTSTENTAQTEPTPQSDGASEALPVPTPEKDEQPPNDASMKPLAKVANTPPSPLQDVIEKKNTLPLPEPPQPGNVSQVGSRNDYTALAKINVGNVDKVNLKVRGTEVVLPEGDQFGLVAPLLTDGSTKTWDVTRQTSSAGNIGGGAAVGTFQLRNGILWFKWADKPPSALLKYCLLEIGVKQGAENSSVQCALVRPKEVTPLRFSFEKKEYKIPLNVDTSFLPLPKPLVMKVEFRGIDSSRYRLEGASTSSNASARFDLRNGPPSPLFIDLLGPGGHSLQEDKLVRVGMKLTDSSDGELHFEMDNHAYLPQIQDSGAWIGQMPPDFTTVKSLQPFAIDSENNTRRAWSDTVKKINERLTSLKNVIEMAKAAIREAQTEEAKTNAQSRLDQAKKRQVKYNNALEEAKGFDKWFGRLKEAYRDLEENLTIDCELSIESGSGRTIILQSIPVDQ